MFKDPVLEDRSFCGLIDRIRAGDQEAAAELVRLYQPELRRFIHFQLTDVRLRRLLDSLDICQSVLGHLFVRLAAGRFELTAPGQLHRLLQVMARNKLRDHVRRQNTQQRNSRPSVRGGGDLFGSLIDPGPGPGELAADSELVEVIRGQLGEEDRHLLDQRLAGRRWGELAAERGDAPDAVRKRVERAVERAARQLGWVESASADSPRSRRRLVRTP